MIYVVAKPFNSHNRRFPIGAEVLETDDVSPLDFDILKARRWIVSEGTKTGTSAVRAGAKAEAAAAEEEAIVTQDDLRREWETAATTGVQPEGVNWAIFITNEELFGKVVYEEGNVIGVQVPWEETQRFYRAEQIDRVARTAEGRWRDSTTVPPRKPRR